MAYLRAYSTGIIDSGVDANFRKLSNALRTDVLQNVTFLALVPVEESAKQYCPVKTGNLQRSIHIEHGTESTGTVDQNHGHSLCGVSLEDADYALHVEYGTPGRTPHAYLRPAWDENIDRIKQILQDELKDAIAAEMGMAMGKR